MDQIPNIPGCVKQLPNEVFPCIIKYLKDEDCVALVLSGSIRGFAAFYRLNRKQVISDRCFSFLPGASSWSNYFRLHIVASAVTTFNVNHNYWLPAELLAGAIIQMENLEELCIKDTKISLTTMANILNHCSEVAQLDFCFRFEEDWKNVDDGLKLAILDSLAPNFKKLTSLKISTCVLDARDYRHDPWRPILSILSLCRDCVNLGLEITYTGESLHSSFFYSAADQFTDVNQIIRELFYPRLGWMTSLKSLIVTKLGPFGSFSLDSDECSAVRGYVRSLMLDDLLSWLFSEERAPRSLQNLWIHLFLFEPGHQAPQFCAPTLKSCQVELLEEKEYFAGFPNLEVVAQIFFTKQVSKDMLHLPNLKYAHGWLADIYENDVSDFIKTHPRLEYLSVADYTERSHLDPVWPNELHPLPNLKVLNYLRDRMNSRTIETFVELYPNVERLALLCKEAQNIALNTSHLEENKLCLSSIKFKKLTALCLQGFQFHDGAFLLKVVKQCPKLRRLDLFNEFGLMESTTFAASLDLALPFAVNLKDFRLRCAFQESGSIILPLLKSFLAHCPLLERLVLMMDKPSDAVSSGWDHPSETADFIVRFAAEMPRLVALCIVVVQLEADLIEEVNSRITAEVLPYNPLSGSISVILNPCRPIQMFPLFTTKRWSLPYSFRLRPILNFSAALKLVLSFEK